MDAGPEVCLLTFGWRAVPQKKAGEGVVDRLVVDEDVDRAFRRRNQVDQGQSFSPLGGLRKAVDLGICLLYTSDAADE